MKPCKTCKHWKIDGEKHWSLNDVCNPFDFDTGQNMVFDFEVKACCNPKQVLFERPVISNGFSLLDGSDYTATLLTGEDFGCVLHENSGGDTP